MDISLQYSVNTLVTTLMECRGKTNDGMVTLIGILFFCTCTHSFHTIGFLIKSYNVDNNTNDGDGRDGDDVDDDDEDNV